MPTCSTPSRPEQLRAVTLTEHVDLVAAAALYRLAFGYSDPALTLNPLLLAAFGHTGGAVVGVRSGSGELVGIAYGFPGVDAGTGGRGFLYSQIAAVHPAWQSRGVGRLLKYKQRELAQQAGFNEMRWVYDPFLARNAHFNLVGLGAEAIALCENYYGTPGSDRLLLSWRFAAGPADEAGCGATSAATAASRPREEGAWTADGKLAFTSADWGVPQGTTWGYWLPFPAGQVPPEVRTRVLGCLSAALGAGHRLRDCVQHTEHTAAYAITRPES